MIKQVIAIASLMFAFSSLRSELIQQNSATGQSVPYREVCQNAAQDSSTFQNFRSMEAYFQAVECGLEGEFASYLRNHATKRTFTLIPQFRELDLYGNPVRHLIPGFGLVSGTTLRYVLVADHISRLFSLPNNYKVVEIGAGFGGQAFVLSKLLPFSQYYIYDLPEVEMLIKRMMSTLSVQNITCLEAHEQLPTDSIDLFISNYAFTECDRATQLDYFERVVVKAKRGYMLCNNSNPFDHLSKSELINLLQENGLNPKILSEPVFSYTGNSLIIWDTTTNGK